MSVMKQIVIEKITMTTGNVLQAPKLAVTRERKTMIKVGQDIGMIATEKEIGMTGISMIINMEMIIRIKVVTEEISMMKGMIGEGVEMMGEEIEMMTEEIEMMIEEVIEEIEMMTEEIEMIVDRVEKIIEEIEMMTEEIEMIVDRVEKIIEEIT